MNFLPPIDNPGANSNNIRGGGGGGVMNISTQELTPVRGVKSQVENIDDMGATGSQIPDLNESTNAYLPPPSSTYNYYNTKKTMAQGLMDVALISANASQLKAVLYANDLGQGVRYHDLILTLLGTSIALQVLVAILLLVIGRMDLDEQKNRRVLDILNNLATGIIFIITVINVLITSLGVDVDLSTRTVFVTAQGHAALLNATNSAAAAR